MAFLNQPYAETLAFQELQEKLDRINSHPNFQKGGRLEHLKRASSKTADDLVFDANRTFKKWTTPPYNIFDDNFDPNKLRPNPFDVISSDEDEFGPIHNLIKISKNKIDSYPNLVSIKAEIHQAETEEQDVYTTPPQEEQNENSKKLKFFEVKL